MPAAVLPLINCALQIGIATMLLCFLSVACPHGSGAEAAEVCGSARAAWCLPCRCVGAVLRWMGRSSYAILLLHGAPLRYLLYPHRGTDTPRVYLQRCCMFLAWVFALAHCVTEFVAPPARGGVAVVDASARARTGAEPEAAVAGKKKHA